MGKSPGKWIKGIIFGKKQSKSNLSKERVLSRSVSEKPVRVTSKEPIPTLIVDAPLLSNPVPVIDMTDHSVFRNVEAANLRSQGVISSPTKQEGDVQTVWGPGLSNVSEEMRVEQAATVVQASFRNYQACQEFRNLKGVIKLQAVIRGCLVRRQAVATLFCVQGIVKLQAIVRGNMVRRSSIANANEPVRMQSLVFLVSKDDEHKDPSEISKHIAANNFLNNAFIHKLLSSAPAAMPLSLQYGPEDPNFAWDWLLRWSMLHVCAPNWKQKETCGSNNETAQIDQVKPKCTDEDMPSSTVESVEEYPQSVNDKSKRGLNKNPKIIGSRAEADVVKLKKYPTKLSKSLDKPRENMETAVENRSEKSSRRTSLPAKLDNRVPSYMSTTASSKAKVRFQVIPNFGEDAVDNNALARRHSLPSFVNGKQGSSPRVQRLLQTNGKGGSKIDRSLSSSRDFADKVVIQPDWRR